MTTIAYDRPIEDLIDALSATKHVTHTSCTKTSVTLHHNGGVANSREDVLNTWKTREASAHFDVDVNGNIAQFVKVDEIAWGVGNWAGNQTTISIEMGDATGSPSWQISPATQAAATRLAAWLFVHVIKQRPSAANLFPHQHWTQTDCPGPWAISHFDEIIAEMQAQYDAMAGTVPPPKPHPVPSVSLRIVQMCAREDPGRPQGQTTNSAQVMPVQAALEAEGFLSSSDPRWGRGSFGSMTVTAYKAWQERLGYGGSDADGIPGQTSLSKLGVKHGFRVVA